MSERCTSCLRPIQTCYCEHITPVHSGVKFIYLMHPHEAYKQRTGTGRLASLSLRGSEIIIGKSFDDNLRIRELVSNPAYYPMMLYPGDTAVTAESFNFKDEIEGRKLLIILIDATWVMARKIMYRSSELQKLPRLTFGREYRSEFLIKTQPADYCLSTIECSYYLIKELQKFGICDVNLNVEGLMTVFKKMVNFQIDCKEKRFAENLIK